MSGHAPSRFSRRAPEAAPPPGATADPIAELRALCLTRIDPSIAAGLSAPRLLAEVESVLAAVATERRIQLNHGEQSAIAAALVDDMVGLGPLEKLLQDASVTDILANGPDAVFIEREGRLEASDVRFRDATHLLNVCHRIAARVGRRVDESSPMVDARLKDGSRVNIVLPPLALNGPCMSIRKFNRRQIDMARLAEAGSLHPALGRALAIVTRCRCNLIVSGGTGSGKTTLLNALSRFIDRTERVITIEDAAELQLQQPHVVRLETRPPSLEGLGEATQRDLLRNALRMRPDRIIIGEVRGVEAFDMLQAMSTGHDGSMSTIHANSAADALMRLEALVQMATPGVPTVSIRRQIAAAVDVVVQVERQRDGVRRVTAVVQLCGMENDMIVVAPLFHFDRRAAGPPDTGAGADAGGPPDAGASGHRAGTWRATGTAPAFAGRLDDRGLLGEWEALVAELTP